jgi:UDP-N-acetylmuramate: L-alanyl-gamma-D-glutamyl-meso-diaminopimelate ligase
MTGRHSVNNGLAAIIAAEHCGVAPEIACKALSDFPGVKRRMEIVGEVRDITIYDDFAHHPTAIATTLQGLRRKVGNARIIAIIEPRSNTMRLGVYKNDLASSVADADQALWFQPEELNWNLGPVVAARSASAQVFDSIDAIVAHVVAEARPGDQVVIMSNGGFGGIHQKLMKALAG